MLLTFLFRGCTTARMGTERTTGLTRGASELRAAARRAGGQAELARRLGVHRQQISQWCLGQRVPATRTALLIASRCRIPIGAWYEPASLTPVPDSNAA